MRARCLLIHPTADIHRHDRHVRWVQTQTFSIPFSANNRHATTDRHRCSDDGTAAQVSRVQEETFTVCGHVLLDTSMGGGIHALFRGNPDENVKIHSISRGRPPMLLVC